MRANTLLRAFIELINSNPAWKELKFAAPLAQLSGALGDLNLGRVQPIRNHPLSLSITHI